MIKENIHKNGFKKAVKSYLYGTIMATLCLAVQFGGIYRPPHWISGYLFSTKSNSNSVLLTGTGPRKQDIK